MTKEKAMEIVLDGIEIAVKHSLNESVLKDVPIFGTIIKLYEVGTSVRDSLYIYKIEKFLNCLDDISEQKKTEVTISIRDNNEEVQRLSQKILLILETQSDIQKSEYIANFFLAYVSGKLNESDLRRALDVLSNCFLDDLNNLISDSRSFILSTYQELESMGYTSLINSPLIGLDNSTPSELRSNGWSDDEASSVFYKSTDFCHVFCSAYKFGALLRQGDG